MTDTQYQICVTVLFVYVVFPYYNVVHTKSQQHSRPYIFAELPSNLLLRKIGPSVLMPTLLTIWGIMVTLQGQQLGGFFILDLSLTIHTIFFTPGLVTSYAGLATVRAFLGLVEGPMFPGIVLYLSGFYTRKELSLRYAALRIVVILVPMFTLIL